MNDFDLIQRAEMLLSLYRLRESPMRTLRVGAVQCAWSVDPVAHRAMLRRGVELAADAGAQVILMQELTLSPYFCDAPDVPDALATYGEDVETGPTITFARELAVEFNVCVQASLYERTPKASVARSSTSPPSKSTASYVTSSLADLSGGDSRLRVSAFETGSIEKT